jgi:hypothetical protein
MSGFELVACVIAAFFGAGVVVGVLLVEVLPSSRRRRARTYSHSGGRGPRMHSPDDEVPPWRT